MAKAILFSLLGLSVLSCTPAQKGPRSAKEFLTQADEQLRDIRGNAMKAEWINANFITDDTTKLASHFSAQFSELGTNLAKQSKQFKGKNDDEARQLYLYMNFLTLPSPANKKENKELAELSAELQSMYGSGKYCRQEKTAKPFNDLEKIIGESRDSDQLLDAWVGWRTISKPMKEKYQRLVVLGNKGATELGFQSVADMWKAKYDMPSAEFEPRLEELWNEVKPLYQQLHCYVRTNLNKKYGDSVAPKEGPIPAHLLGNMWAQSWDKIQDILPFKKKSAVNLDQLLKKADYDHIKMVRTAEDFFVSLGMPKLPESFYKKSLFLKPKDRDVVCHASAWDLDAKEDVRIKMCIKIDDEDFRTIHHELGHIYYYLAYNKLPLIYQSSANDGFHEALGDTVELSITPKYLKDINLLKTIPNDSDADIAQLMNMALKKIAFMPFGLMVDKWRWKVFSGEVKPENYNTAWWELREKYQGVKSPVERPADAFDPGAKYHIPGGTPYSRYFLAHMLQFQFHKALCEIAGHTGPLHRCSIFGNEKAGLKLWSMMQMGASKPWPEALEAVTGSPKMDASAVRSYFKPLEEWLVKQNTGAKCGW